MDEIRSLVDDTHALKACKTRERALPMHLLLKAKYLANANFDKYKARIVIGGNLQHRDQDIDTSSFCVRVQFIPMQLGIANLDKLTVRAVDIKTAYLHAIVKSNIQEAGSLLAALVPSHVQPCQSRWFNHTQSS